MTKTSQYLSLAAPKNLSTMHKAARKQGLVEKCPGSLHELLQELTGDSRGGGLLYVMPIFWTWIRRVPGAHIMVHAIFMTNVLHCCS